MDLARFNVFWFAWLLSPALIMLYSTRKQSKKWLIAGSLTSAIAIYVFSNLAVIEKWSLRMKWATNPKELELATADGANKVFNLYFIAPTEAILFTIAWGFAGRILWKSLNKSHNNSIQRTS